MSTISKNDENNLRDSLLLSVFGNFDLLFFEEVDNFIFAFAEDKSIFDDNKYTIFKYSRKTDTKNIVCSNVSLKEAIKVFNKLIN